MRAQGSTLRGCAEFLSPSLLYARMRACGTDAAVRRSAAHPAAAARCYCRSPCRARITEQPR